MTNGYRLRLMSNEELAVTIMCPNDMGLSEIECDRSDEKNCCQFLLDWMEREEETT